jgi:hypothetical protein
MKLSKKQKGMFFSLIGVSILTFVLVRISFKDQKPTIQETDMGHTSESTSLPMERQELVPSSNMREQNTPPRFRRSGWDGKAITKKKTRNLAPNEPRLIQLIDSERENEVVQFSQSSEKYISLPGIEAINKIQLTDEEKAESLGDFLNYSLQRREAGEAMTGGFEVVYHAERGNLALVTGNLKVKYAPDFDEGLGLAGKFGMESVSYFPNLKLSFFSTEKRKVSELLQLADRIRQEPGVSEVSLDLIDRLPSVQ